MSEMVERVARAICKTAGEPDHCAKFYEISARAAIEAMREPTEAMCQAYLDNDFTEADSWGSYVGPIQRWRAMIDEALK